jgi:hypothetical protein
MAILTPGSGLESVVEYGSYSGSESLTMADTDPASMAYNTVSTQKTDILCACATLFLTNSAPVLYYLSDCLTSSISLSDQLTCSSLSGAAFLPPLLLPPPPPPVLFVSPSSSWQSRLWIRPKQVVHTRFVPAGISANTKKHNLEHQSILVPLDGVPQ